MKSITIQGQKRESVGKKSTKALRDAELVPCVVYGGKEPLHFSTEEKSFKNLVYTPEAHTVSIEVGGQTIPAVLQDIQFHPITDRILHVDFYQLSADKPVVMEVPVKITGRAKGVVAGGVLRQSFRKLKLKAVPAIANAAPTTKETAEVKKYDSLNTAAQDYAKALQEISNYGSREMLKSINPDVDKYVAKINDPTLKKQWEDSNTMLIEQFEVSVYKVNENGNDGEVVFLIKGYDEKALDKYLGDNASQYAKVDSGKDEVEVDIEKYIKLQYNYLKNTKKINLATSTVKFAKGSDNKWQVTK